MGLTTLAELCKYGFNSSSKVGIPTPATLETNKQTRILLQKRLYGFIWVFFAPNWGLFFYKAKRMSKLVYLNKGSKGCTAAMPSKTCKKKPRANIKPVIKKRLFNAVFTCICV